MQGAALIAIDIGGSVMSQTVWTASLATVYNNQTVLTGTTGPDTNMSFSPVSGGVWVENRLGFDCDITLTCIGPVL